MSEPEIQKMVRDNEERERGAYGAEPDMCKNMWKTFTGLTGHDLCFQGDSQGSQVTLSHLHMMNVQRKREWKSVWVYNYPVCAHNRLVQFDLCSHSKVYSRGCICVVNLSFVL